MTCANQTVPSQSDTPKLAGLLRQALPADWTPEEQLFFRNWLQQVVTLQDTLTSIGKDQPRLLWRASKIYLKLRGALVRAAEAAEQHNAQNQRPTTKGQGAVSVIKKTESINPNELDGRENRGSSNAQSG